MKHVTNFSLTLILLGALGLPFLFYNGEKTVTVMLPSEAEDIKQTAAAMPAVEEEERDMGTEEGSVVVRSNTSSHPPLTISPASGGIPLHLTREDGGGEVGEVGLLVVRGVDGDTIEVEWPSTSSGNMARERVRYIGVNTPESVDPRRKVQCFGKEAAAYNKKLVLGKRVRLEPDVEDRDKYGRLLRYVWLGDTMVNEQLMQDGYAQLMTIPPNVKYVELFKQAQTAAREAKRGLWAKCKKS